MELYTNIHDMRESALKKLAGNKGGKGLTQYLEGGAGKGGTVVSNADVFSRYALIPRPLESGRIFDTKVQLPGLSQPVEPVFIAPTAWHGLFHPSAELCTLIAAQRAKALYIISSFSQTDWEALSTGAQKDIDKPSLFYQMLMIEDEQLMLSAIEQAQNSGCSAIVLTVDAPNGCTACRVSTGKERVSLDNMPLLPRKKGDRVENLVQYIQTYISGGTYDWDYIERIVQLSPLPIYLKGIMHPLDVREASKRGVKAVIVSNHGGRQLEGVISSLDALRNIQETNGGELPLLMDGGIRSGVDVLKALMSGATAVGVGRPIHYGLTLGGTNGVQKVLSILNDELREALQLCGFSSPKIVREKGKEQLMKL